ncbi:MAG: radical SAM protein [Candidatus Omnitrophota bacterium]
MNKGLSSLINSAFFNLASKRIADLRDSFYIFRVLRNPPKIPNTILFEITNLCNLKCAFCYQSSNGFKVKKGLMDFELFAKAIEEFAELHRRNHSTGNAVIYTTGETFLHPQWRKMLSLCSRFNLRSVLSTNGNLLDKTNIYALLDARLDYLNISVEGYDKESYERKRINGNFEQLLDNLQQMKDIFSSHNGHRPYVVIRAVVFPQELNHSYYKKYFELWSKFADEIDFNPLSTQAGHMVNEISERNLTGKRKNCTAPFVQLTINWDGSVGFCCADYNHVIDIGRFPNTALFEIWRSPKLMQVRNAFRKREYSKIPGICQNCEATFCSTNQYYKTASFKTTEVFENQSKIYPWLVK